jgi:hypothetical protein
MPRVTELHTRTRENPYPPQVTRGSHPLIALPTSPFDLATTDVRQLTQRRWREVKGVVVFGHSGPSQTGMRGAWDES